MNDALESNAPPRPVLMLVGLPAEAVPPLDLQVERLDIADEAEALRLLEEPLVGRKVVVAIGPGVDLEAAKRLVAAASSTVRLVLGAAGRHLEAFDEELIEGQIFYLAPEVLEAPSMALLLHAALTRARALNSAAGAPEHSSAVLQKVLEIAERAAMQSHQTAMVELAAEAIRDLLSARRSYGLLHDPVADTLWSGNEIGPQRVESAAVGLTSFVARSGESLRLADMQSDARFEIEADDPLGEGSGHLLAVPVRSSRGNTLAVLGAVRDVEQDPFLDSDVQIIEALAGLLAGLLERASLEEQLEAHASRRVAVVEPSVDARVALFRREAVELYNAGRSAIVSPLDLRGLWSRSAYPLLAVTLVVGFLFAILIPIEETASGPAVLSVLAAGQPTLIALLPGWQQPMLRPGQSVRVRFNIPGIPEQQLRLAEVSNQVLPLEVIRRQLGTSLTDIMIQPTAQHGPSVVVKAHLDGTTLTASGRRFEVYDELSATATVVVSSRPLIAMLVPGLFESTEAP